MPMLSLRTNVVIPQDKHEKLISGLSTIVADGIGKPEQYVMVAIEEASLLMGGKPGPAAFIDLRSIGGLSPAVNGRLSALLCDAMERVLAIPKNRVFINFTEVSGGNWGWNGSTLG